MDPFEKLKETKQLLDEGIINEEEYQVLKARLLDAIDNENPAQKPHASTAAPAPAAAGSVSEEHASTGMKVLSFLIPIVGLILFLIDKDNKPVAAKEELIWAGIGFGVGLLSYIVIVAIAAASLY